MDGYWGRQGARYVAFTRDGEHYIALVAMHRPEPGEPYAGPFPTVEAARYAADYANRTGGGLPPAGETIHW